MSPLDFCHGTAALQTFDQTQIRHTAGKNKPSLVSAPIYCEMPSF